MKSESEERAKWKQISRRRAAYQRKDFCSLRTWSPSQRVTRQAVTSPKDLYSSPLKTSDDQWPNQERCRTGISTGVCLGWEPSATPRSSTRSFRESVEEGRAFHCTAKWSPERRAGLRGRVCWWASGVWG